MAYNRFQDDDDKPAARTAATYPQEVNASLQQITSSFNQLDGAIKNVEQQYMRLSKCQNQEELRQFQTNMQQQLSALQSVNLPQIQQAILILQKNQNLIADQGQKSQVQALVNKFNALYNTKKQQIVCFSTSFSKISVKLTQSADDQTNSEQNLQNFKMQMIQEEVDEQLDQIKDINSQMTEITSLMKTMSATVYQGGQTIELISDRVREADQKVVQGVDNLEKSKQTQKSKNKWLFWGLGVLAVVVVVIILVFTL